MGRSDLPFGSEFSPSQIDLARVLEFAHQHGGDWKAFEKAVRETYFDTHTKTDDYNRAKLANNCKLGMIAYGLIERDARLTAVGQTLYGLRASPGELYLALGRHVLANLHGMTFVQCIQDMKQGGEEVTLQSLRVRLDERGVHFPRGGKHPSIMRLWLEKAGVFTEGWRVNEVRLKEVLGTAPEEFEALAGLTSEQRTYLRTIVNLALKEPLPSNEIERLATATYGTRFDEKNLPKSVLYPLRDAGYITLERGTAKTGRGAKPFMVAPTEKLRSDVIEPLLVQAEKQLASDLRPFLRRPLAEIRKELRAPDRHTRGLSLEALAVRLMRLLDLTYVSTRLRGDATGGAEVDVIFESARLVYSRWQVQCKNTDRVSLDDVAKEVGLTHMLRSNVIVMVSTGSIGPEARRYADRIMADSNLCVVMVEGTDLASIEANPVSIVDVFNREARHAMKLKELPQ